MNDEAYMHEINRLEGELDTFKLQADDLELLVRRLCHQIKGENSVKRLALDYLQRTGRVSSPLRDGEFAAAD